MFLVVNHVKFPKVSHKEIYFCLIQFRSSYVHDWKVSKFKLIEEKADTEAADFFERDHGHFKKIIFDDK